MKTAELTGAALDWAVATANGDYPQWDAEWEVFYAANGDDMDYSTNWSQGGPIIERERIAVTPITVTVGSNAGKREWFANYMDNGQAGPWADGDTPLIAAMRCYVASKLGDEVEIPKELN